MKLKNIIKYLIRFVFLQTLVFGVTVWYFDKYVFINQEHKFEIYLNLIDDRNRFYDFIPLSWVTVDSFLFVLILIFLVLLYTTRFYTYVNELDFSYENRYLDDYFMLYLLWNSFLFSSLYLFRIEGLSRSNLALFSFLIPLILILFRNSEILSSLLGRSVSNENYISFNLDEFSNFKNLRIIAFRKEKQSISVDENRLDRDVVREVNKLNKLINLNLVILRLENKNELSSDLEEFLIKLNKKVLIISKKKIGFNSKFIYRQSLIDSNYIYYFNNDIQYGAKFILKRVFDIVLSLFLIAFLSPLIIYLSFLVRSYDGSPSLVKQTRVGLHGSKFQMYKYRTMYKNAHIERDNLKDSNEKSGPLFKIDGDPRVIKGLRFLRRFSLDELPQLFNVLKGEMSLVGPRPLFEEDTQYFDKNYIRRLNVLPGMTGLLQINERNTDDFDIWYKYDIEYIDNWTLYLDVKILLKTFSAVVNKNNIGS